MIIKSEKLKLAALPIIIFGGSPINVEVPPTLDAIISVIKNGTGLTFKIWQITIVIGPTNNTVVTLSSNADNMAVIKIK